MQEFGTNPYYAVFFSPQQPELMKQFC